MAHVLVTGGTGFLGSHTIAQLLTTGHTVTTTVRSLARRSDVERMLAVAGAPSADGSPMWRRI
ncbi:GDP-mannose 4,6-dehydratase [Streptomyces sp. NPDC052207]|uniref:NAD-dependent epimerase/dehydratase family protein n=1 Tax=Streptomyces sp. NPDC052207 TaxID=3155418 RepID=UPI00343D9F9D